MIYAVPDTPPRALGLIRVSKEREGMIAPEIQQVAIRDYALARGYEIVEWVEGLDESGSRSRSAWWPRLEQASKQVEDGTVDVIIVWKFSRVARQRLKWATALDRVEAAGGRIESATEQIDTTTSAGRFARGMLGELNAFYAETIGEGWKETHARRIAAGKPANGKPRWGYVYDRDQKLHVPDPVTGPVLADLYTRYVAGESVYTLVRWLNAHGHRTTYEGLWTDHALRRVLDSGFASGRFRANGKFHDGVHEPLIDQKTWQAYQDARNLRRAAPARRERSQYLLSGLVRCSRCQRPMVAGQFGNQRQPKYRCKTGKQQGPEGCSGGYVTAAFVEQAVIDWLETLAEEVDQSAKSSIVAKARRTTTRTEIARLSRAVSKAEDALGRLAIQQAETPSPPQVYRKAHAEMTGQIEELTTALEELRLEDRTAVRSPGRAAKGLLDRWDRTPVAHRRVQLGELLRYVDVTTGRPRGTFEIVPTWAT